MRATDGTWRFSLIGRANDPIAARIVIASTSGVFAIAAFLLARRVAGAFSSSLPVPQLVAVAVAIVVWALVVRELASRTPLVVAVAIVAQFMFALACSYPGGRVVDWLVWPAGMFAIVLCPSLIRSSEERSERRKNSNAVVETDGQEDAEKVLQQLNRVRTAEGYETVHGTLIAEFAAGERQTTIYVAFCPPFERLPCVEVNIADDSDATVKLAQALHNGAQFEVRLPHPADDNSNVAVDFYAADSEPTLVD